MSYKSDLVKEYGAIGPYRIRVIRDDRGGGKVMTLIDIREFVESEKFEGFTRRGIRIINQDQARHLISSLEDALKEGNLSDWKPEEAALTP